MSEDKKIKALLKKLPAKPGVYKMIDKENEVLYVGKAKNLGSRVKSYFKGTDKQSVKTQKLVEKIVDIEWVETNSEEEALILETNYIKELRPKFNVLMKDDKNYAYAKITVNEDFPRVEIVRALEKDGAKYFGPKNKASHINSTMEFLGKLFPLRTCKLDIKETKKGVEVKGHGKYPCLEYQLKRCVGPCIGKISKEEYREYINQIIKFFEGEYEALLSDIRERMMKEAAAKEFEKAAKLRDLMKIIEGLQTKQIVSDVSMESRDIIGIFHDLGKTFVALFQVRIGKVIANENFVLENEGEYEEMIKAFITGYYEKAGDIPKEILIPQELEDKKSLEYFLKEEIKTSVKILSPQKGKKSDLIELAMNNAKSYAESHRARWMNDKLRKEQAEKDILTLINTNAEGKKIYEYPFPKRMESFDVSHYGGENTVASLVVFMNGEEEKSEYRRYTVKTVGDKIDDYASLEEVLSRRLAEIENILSLEEKSAHEENFVLEKLKKKDIEKLFDDKKEKKKKEKKNKNKKEKKIKKKEVQIIYGLKEKDKIISWVELRNYGTKIREIINIGSDKKIKDKKKISEHEKILFKKFLTEFSGKEFWIFTKDRKKYEEFGFKKLKTLKKDWQKDPGLVPEEIANNSKVESGYALRFKIPKKGQGVSNLPNLVLIDGGKGQLSSVVKIFEKNNWAYKDNAFYRKEKKNKDNKNALHIIVCSIAKKNEEIFFPNESKARDLKNSSEGCYLMQRLRDEAHRFAVEFNRNKRTKKALTSVLDKIPGIGQSTKKKLLKSFGSVEGIKDASDDNLKLCVGDKLTKILRNSL